MVLDKNSGGSNLLKKNQRGLSPYAINWWIFKQFCSNEWPKCTGFSYNDIDEDKNKDGKCKSIKSDTVCIY